MTTKMEDVYICSSFRTVIGKINGQFSKIPAIKLGSNTLLACYKKINLNPENIDQVIIGQVFSSGQGQNPARQTAIFAKLPPQVTAHTVNMQNGSGLKAIFEGFNCIRTGNASVIYAGGQENMTMANHFANIRFKTIMGTVEWKDTLYTDGIVDTFLDLEMDKVAEHMSKKYNVTQHLQNKFAVMSHNLAAESINNKHFLSEIAPIPDYLEPFIDECPMHNVNLEQLTDPTISENCYVSKINSACMADGAAGVILVSGSHLKKFNVSPQVQVVGMVQVGCEPIDMTLASITAIQELLKKTKWSIDDVDLFEIDDSFAVQAMLCIDNLCIDISKVNISGGSIAFGNPLGASSARMLVTLIHNMKRLKKRKGIVSLCINGGMGIAVAVENVESFKKEKK